MKKIFFVVFILLITCGVCSAEIYNSLSNKSGFVSVNAPGYVQFYDIDTIKITAKFKYLSDTEERRLIGTAKESYKKAKKIEKAISEGNYPKAIKVDEDFLPSHIQYYNYFVQKNDYRSALNEMISIKRINSMARVLNDDIVSYKLGMLFYLDKNYNVALTYLSNMPDKHNPSEENLWFALGDIYFHLNKFESSKNFASKIAPTSINYIPAQEILYEDYYNLGEVSNAEKCAEFLVKNKPSANNYLRLVQVSSKNEQTKLEMLERAKDLAITSSDETSLLLADSMIAKIEQKKIDDAAAKLSGFFEKPEWYKISNEIASIIRPLELSARQEAFFQSTNICIAGYKGEDLKRCFEYVNREQDKLTAKLMEEYNQAYQEKLLELQELQRQQQFYQQTYFERLYMDDFFYMKYPYFYGYW